MAQAIPFPVRDNDGAPGLDSIADELKRESDRLHQLADELRQREEFQAEMQANYPHFKEVVYAWLREQFERELPPIGDKNLQELAAEENGRPLESVLEELERMKERR